MEVWVDRAKKHTALVSPWADAFLKRREISHTHPIHDFLFVYYNCSPLKLKQWIPSFKEALVVAPDFRETYSWFNEYWFRHENHLLYLNKERIQENILGLARFIAELCRNILNRQPRFGCFGLHEWAMVYKQSPEAIRHQGQKLRLCEKTIANFVEGQSLCCTHYDAYRFFTKEALPLNQWNPTLDTRLQMEQGGCLHANMDVYKWSIKLWPWIGSDFLAKAFFLALEGRELDMRASPYDFKEAGYSPICIETEEGRKQYQVEQQLYAKRASILRKELLIFCEEFIDFCS